ncbi:MAG: Trk system potassium transport protein TrkA, partial [Proteobacteria bacterium]|nr:Trk system potassium transport protein TrkA [Pseudomonadota bacterium]
PPGVILGAVVREDEVIIPRGSTTVRINDLVILFATSESIKKVEKMLAASLEFF